MSSRSRLISDFLLHPPWGLLALLTLFLFIGVCILFRCSELGGEAGRKACRTAVVIAGLATLFGLVPVLKCRGGSGLRLLIGFSIGTGLRLLVSVVAIAIVLHYTSISPVRLVVFWILSYCLLFLPAETVITLRLLKTVVWETQDDNDGNYNHWQYTDCLE